MKDVILCIGRQFGSGGRQVGKILSEKLSIPFYDKEIIREAAASSGIVEGLFEKADEQPTNSFLYTLSLGTHAQGMAMLHYPQYLTNDSLFNLQCTTIQNMAKKGSCIFLGRCADYVLQNEPNCVSVFLYADKNFRVNRVMQSENLNADDALALIRKADKKRANYYNFYSDKSWGVAESYDLCISTSKLGINKTAQFILDYIAKR